MEPGIMISRVEKEIADVGANDELSNEVVNVAGKRQE